MHNYLRNGCCREVEQNTQRCRCHITLSISLLDHAYRDDTAPYLVSVFIVAYVMQLPRKQTADQSSLLKKH